MRKIPFTQIILQSHQKPETLSLIHLFFHVGQREFVEGQENNAQNNDQRDGKEMIHQRE